MVDANTLIEKDTRRSWYVCLGAFLLVGISLGLTNSFGVLFIGLLNEFHQNKRKTAWVGALQLSCYFFMSYGCNILTRIFGFKKVVFIGNILFSLGLVLSSFAHNIWVLYITYGILFGCGTCLLLIPSLTILPVCFKKHLATATGIVMAGNSIFVVCIGPLYELLIRIYGWRSTLRFLTLLSIPVGLGCCLFPNNDQLRSNESVDRKRYVDISVLSRFLKNRAFLLWVIAMILLYLGYYLPHVHLISYSEDISIAPGISVYSISCMYAFNALGKVGFGKLLDYFHCDVYNVNSISILILAVSVTLLPITTAVYQLFLFASFYGFALGVQSVALFIITLQICDPRDSGQAVTYLFTVLSIPVAIGPTVAGWLYDNTKSYHLAFFVAGGILALSSLLSVFLPFVKETTWKQCNTIGGKELISMEESEAYNTTDV